MSQVALALLGTEVGKIRCHSGLLGASSCVISKCDNLDAVREGLTRGSSRRLPNSSFREGCEPRLYFARGRKGVPQTRRRLHQQRSGDGRQAGVLGSGSFDYGTLFKVRYRDLRLEKLC